MSKNIITTSLWDNDNVILRYLFLPIKLILYFNLLNNEIKNANKVFIHGLFDKKIILFFYLFPSLNKKCSWLIWGGGDLNKNEAFSLNPFNRLKVKVKSNFKNYLTYIEEDYIDILTHYFPKEESYLTIFYISQIYPYQQRIILLEKKLKINLF